LTALNGDGPASGLSEHGANKAEKTSDLALVPENPNAVQVLPSISTFTSWKLDLQKYIVADPRLKPADKLVALCILHHLNARYCKAFVSVETICDEVCISRSSVLRAIKRLRQTGWLASRKTMTANIYAFSDRNLNAPN
jgi:hypothetical protein